MSVDPRISSAQLQWNKLGFGDDDITGWAMYAARYTDGTWQKEEVTAFSPIMIDPRAAALNYGVGAFEDERNLLHRHRGRSGSGERG